jgi:tetratricopeptide (TPR) repeat protein
MRDLERALEHYNLALEYAFDEFWVRYNRGFLQIDLGNINEACADLERVLELNPEYPGLKQKLIELYKE